MQIFSPVMPFFDLSCRYASIPRHRFAGLPQKGMRFLRENRAQGRQMGLAGNPASNLEIYRRIRGVPVPSHLQVLEDAPLSELSSVTSGTRLLSLRDEAQDPVAGTASPASPLCSPIGNRGYCSRARPRTRRKGFFPAHHPCPISFFSLRSGDGISGKAPGLEIPGLRGEKFHPLLEHPAPRRRRTPSPRNLSA